MGRGIVNLERNNCNGYDAANGGRRACCRGVYACVANLRDLKKDCGEWVYAGVSAGSSQQRDFGYNSKRSADCQRNCGGRFSESGDNHSGSRLLVLVELAMPFCLLFSYGFWQTGDEMRVIKISQFQDSLVLHFSTDGNRINAYTLASTLVAMADAAKEANAAINPGYDIEVVVETLGPGSFRAKIRAIYTSSRNIFSKQNLTTFVLAILANFFMRDSCLSMIQSNLRLIVMRLS
jgi:hypothetical protein